MNTVLSPRESGRYIAANCEHVTINQENIKKTAEILADAFKLRKISISNWRKHDLHPKVRSSCLLRGIQENFDLENR